MSRGLARIITALLAALATSCSPPAPEHENAESRARVPLHKPQPRESRVIEQEQGALKQQLEQAYAKAEARLR